MAWFDRSGGGKKEPSEDPTNTGLNPVGSEGEKPPESPGDELIAYLYKGSRVTGQLAFDGPAKIDGSVEGEVLCRGMLTIGEEAEIRAKISGEVVIIRGRVEGDVAAKEKVELESPARLYGNIDTPRLIITEGVVFDGCCSMGRAKEKGKVQSPPGTSNEKAFEGETPKLINDQER